MKFKTLIIIVLAVVAMFALGWVSFHWTDTEANITIDTQEIKEDTGKAIETSKQLIDEAQDALDEDEPGDAGKELESAPKTDTTD